jgi:hypothetical protein
MTTGLHWSSCSPCRPIYKDSSGILKVVLHWKIVYICKSSRMLNSVSMDVNNFSRTADRSLSLVSLRLQTKNSK